MRPGAKNLRTVPPAPSSSRKRAAIASSRREGEAARIKGVSERDLPRRRASNKGAPRRASRRAGALRDRPSRRLGVTGPRPRASLLPEVALSTMPSRTLQILAAVTIACCGTAQESKPPAPPTAPAPAEQAPAAQAPKGPHFLIRQYPRDRDVPVAVVAGRTVTLGNVIDHIERRHHPGFKRALEVQPGIQRMLQSDLIAPWVRHFADIEALKHSLGDEQPDATKLEAAQSETLKARFQNFLDAYVGDLKSHGRPSTLSQDKVNKLLADFQLNNGLSVELQGLLDFLEPGEYTRGQLHGY